MQNIIYRDQNVTIFQSALYQTNSTVVVTDDVVLVIDPACLPDEVAAIRQYVESVRAKRAVFLIFTHSDFDHIIGYGAFVADKVFATRAFAERLDKDDIVDQIIDFDQQYYIERSYPLEYPTVDYMIFRDAMQYRHGRTKLTFYTAPGHTSDSMFIVIWQLGICVSGDYLCSTEFPFIRHSSVDYEQTLNKLLHIHDRNWFTRLIPGHGVPALSLNDWMKRRVEALAYLYSLRESIARNIPFDEDSLWERYRFPRTLLQEHRQNVVLMQREYANGLWKWDQTISEELFQRRRGLFFPAGDTDDADDET